MPFDVPGRTRATMDESKSRLGRIRPPSGPFDGLEGATQKCEANLLKLIIVIWDRALKFWLLNEELLVSFRHQRMLNTSLLFVHTARRYYRWNVLANEKKEARSLTE